MSEIERYKALLRLVKQMRDKQKEYFKLRKGPSQSDALRALEQSKFNYTFNTKKYDKKRPNYTFIIAITSMLHWDGV